MISLPHFKLVFSANLSLRAAWHGSRIIIRQVLPESQPIFDFILETYRACDGNWEFLAEQVGVLDDSMEGYLEYAAVFLGNRELLRTCRWIHSCRPLYSLRSREEATRSSCSRFSQREYQKYPKRKSNHTANLIRSSPVNRHTTLASPVTLPRVRIIRATSRWTIMRLIALIIFWVHPENTRLRKESSNDKTMLEVLQASAKEGDETQNLFSSDDLQVTLHRGDHAVELKEKCECLEEARNMQQVLRKSLQSQIDTELQGRGHENLSRFTKNMDRR